PALRSWLLRCAATWVTPRISQRKQRARTALRDTSPELLFHARFPPPESVPAVKLQGLRESTVLPRATTAESPPEVRRNRCPLWPRSARLPGKEKPFEMHRSTGAASTYAPGPLYSVPGSFSLEIFWRARAGIHLLGEALYWHPPSAAGRRFLPAPPPLPASSAGPALSPLHVVRVYR